MNKFIKHLDTLYGVTLTKKDKELLLATSAASFIVMLAVLTISSIEVSERGAHFAANSYTISIGQNKG